MCALQIMQKCPLSGLLELVLCNDGQLYSCPWRGKSREQLCAGRRCRSLTQCAFYPCPIYTLSLFHADIQDSKRSAWKHLVLPQWSVMACSVSSRPQTQGQMSCYVFSHLWFLKDMALLGCRWGILPGSQNQAVPKTQLTRRWKRE